MKRWRIVLFAAATLIGALVWTRAEWMERTRRGNEREAVEGLRALARAEADFRRNDRDGNKIQDFWVGDVAGLHDLIGTSGKPIALIPKAVAAADVKSLRRGKPVPKDGYHFVVMEGDDTLYGHETYASDTQGEPNRGPYYSHCYFGFCAFPSDYPRSGRMTFVINEGNSVYNIDTGGQPVLRWPPPFPGICRKCTRKEHPGASCDVPAPSYSRDD